MTRNLERSIARALYAKFAKNWRAETRLAKVYGKPGSPKRPRFNQWYKMHARDLEMMRESSPRDVAEYMEDPWATQPMVDLQRPALDVSSGPTEDRGVVTIPIAEDGEWEKK